MVTVKILYALLFIISSAFYLLYTEILSAYILIFVIILPLLLASILLFSKFLIRGNITSISNTAVKNDKINFMLTINNKTFIPFSNSVITIEYFNNLINSYDTMVLTIPIHPLCNEKISFSLTSDYCGILNIKIKSIKIYDFIKLFSCKIKPNNITKITILPEIHTLKSINNNNTIKSNDGEIYSKYKNGDDPSEIFALKNYLPGDKPNRIHWNLSLKQDELIVRHYSQPVNSSVLIVLDFSGGVSEKYIRSLDTASDIFASISFFLINNEIPFNFTYFDNKNNCLNLSQINNNSDITSNLKSIFENGPIDSPIFTNEIIKKIYDYSKIIYISSSEKAITQLYNRNILGNIILIYIKNEILNGFDDIEKFDNLIVIPSGKLKENISKIIL